MSGKGAAGTRREELLTDFHFLQSPELACGAVGNEYECIGDRLGVGADETAAVWWRGSSIQQTGCTFGGSPYLMMACIICGSLVFEMTWLSPN